MTTQNQKTLTSKDLPPLIHAMANCSTSIYQYASLRVISKFELLLSASPDTRSIVYGNLESYIEGLLSVRFRPVEDDLYFTASLDEVKEISLRFTFDNFYSAELAPPLDSAEHNQEATLSTESASCDICTNAIHGDLTACSQCEHFISESAPLLHLPPLSRV